MVEAAWIALEHHPHWKALFERLSGRLGKPKAVVAIARKLLRWLERYDTLPGKHRSQGPRLRQYLDQLGLTEQLEEVTYSGRVYRLTQRKEEPT